MKRIGWIAGLLAACFCMGIEAQVLDARANVPFDFWLGHKLMPAGEYSISHSSAGLLAIKREDGDRATAVILTNRALRSAAQTDGKLQFTRYGEDYFLWRIWGPGQQDGYSIPKTSRERELASKNVPSKATGIALLPK